MSEWLAADAESAAIAAAMRRVADAQHTLVDLVVSGGRTIAERQQALAIALGAKPRPTAEHRYLSTACQHDGKHKKCGEAQRARGETGPPHCKYCQAVCCCPTCRHEDLLEAGSVPPAPDADTLVVDVDWDTRAVTFTQTTGRVLRCAVNGVWVEAPDRARMSLGFNDGPRPVAVPVSSAHLVLPHPTRSGPRQPQLGEVVVQLLRPARGETLLLGPNVALVDAWSEDDPPMLLLRVRGPVDAVRALFPGATEFDGPEQVL